MTEQLPFNTSPLPLKLRIDDYVLLDRSGAFDGYAKTQLVEGEILFMNAQHRPHALAKMEIYDRLRDALREIGSTLRPLTEASVAMAPDSMPEPDIVLTSEPDGSGPIPVRSVALIIEVSDTTLTFDLDRKAALYAKHGVPEYWVVDLDGRIMHQMSMPRETVYESCRFVKFGEPVRAMTLDRLLLKTAGLYR